MIHTSSAPSYFLKSIGSYDCLYRQIVTVELLTQYPHDTSDSEINFDASLLSDNVLMCLGNGHYMQ